MGYQSQNGQIFEFGCVAINYLEPKVGSLNEALIKLKLISRLLNSRMCHAATYTQPFT